MKDLLKGSLFTLLMILMVTSCFTERKYAKDGAEEIGQLRVLLTKAYQKNQHLKAKVEGQEGTIKAQARVIRLAQEGQNAIDAYEEQFMLVATMLAKERQEIKKLEKDLVSCQEITMHDKGFKAIEKALAYGK